MGRIFEKSSGGIVYKKDGNNIKILLLKWLNSKGDEEYVIPKGHIEEGEIARETAVREISEEAGLNEADLEVVKFVTKINYTFTAGHLEDSPVIDKDVYLFLIKYTGEKIPEVQKEERFVSHRWVTFEELRDIDIKFDMYSIVMRNKSYFV